jgi:cytochrome c-type biogenesis protein CcmH
VHRATPARPPLRLPLQGGGIFCLLLVLLLAIATSASAVEPGEMLKDPGLEARARAISQELRCLVCQNQSIDDSDADLARDLRVLVRERLKAGDGDQAVKDYVVSRYGDFVLLKPPFKAKTYVLWLAPAVILALGALAIVIFFRRRGSVPEPPPLTAEERRRLARLTREEGA